MTFPLSDQKELGLFLIGIAEFAIAKSKKPLCQCNWHQWPFELATKKNPFPICNLFNLVYIGLKKAMKLLGTRIVLHVSETLLYSRRELECQWKSDGGAQVILTLSVNRHHQQKADWNLCYLAAIRSQSRLQKSCNLKKSLSQLTGLEILLIHHVELGWWGRHCID